MSDIKHAKVTSMIPLDDDTMQIDVQSYYEELAHTLQMIQKHVPTSMQTILKDWIACLDIVIKEKSPELVVRLKGKDGNPTEITKRWVTVKESFNRR